ncbi:hypothetical protein ACFH04_06415 [Streptomyces noboritoensis]|uniref:Uncharacterized protein n=1 Tax=Streptomyces noboritoensis TaxID=67337 RepID=A0ABV6TC53_9ACTN
MSDAGRFTGTGAGRGWSAAVDRETLDPAAAVERAPEAAVVRAPGPCS